MAAETSGPESQPKPVAGDVMHVIGNGPAVLLEVVMSGSDIVAYKVRYPDGTQDSVIPEKALLCERRKEDPVGRSSSRTSQGRPSRDGCESQGLASQPSLENQPLAEREGSSNLPMRRLLASPRGPRQLEYLGRAFDDERRLS
ncbi:BXL6 [Symbiodinium sp. CCMP2592]|nr:BXL6 [Symbiodinium sp. CCMP2592]